MSSTEVYLGIDIGTTGVKATLIDEEWRVLCQSRVEYPTYHPHDFWALQDPWEWWSATSSAITELMRNPQASCSRVSGISVSSQAPTLLGIDSNGTPLSRAVIWMDRRSDTFCERLRKEIGEEAIKQLSGNRIDPYYMLPKLLWEIEHEPDRYKRTSQYLQANGWIIYLLTGKTSIDVSHAALTQMYDIHHECWDQSLLNELGISGDKFPALFQCDEVVGYLSSSAAEQLGLPNGIPVVAGAIDGATAPLGLGFTKEGQAFEMSGGSSGIGVILDRPIHHPNLALLKHAISGKWILKGSMSCTGGSMQWFRDYIDEKPGSIEAYNTYEHLVERIPPGAEGLIYLPYLAGERAPLWDRYARGVFFGLHPQTSKAHIIRAMMEGTAFGLRSILDEFARIGIHISQLCGTGGGYKSSQWTKIKADILETEIHVLSTEIETASLGAAYLASLSTTKRRMECIPVWNPGVTFTPESQSIYRNYYQVFKKLYSCNKDLFKSLHLAGDDGESPDRN